MNFALGWTVRSRLEKMSFSRIQIPANAVSRAAVDLLVQVDDITRFGFHYLLAILSAMSPPSNGSVRMSVPRRRSHCLPLHPPVTSDEEEVSSQDRSASSDHERPASMHACRNNIGVAPSDIYCCYSQWHRQTCITSTITLLSSPALSTLASYRPLAPSPLPTTPHHTYW